MMKLQRAFMKKITKFVAPLLIFSLYSCESSSLYNEALFATKNLFNYRKPINIEYLKSLPYSAKLVNYQGTEAILILEEINDIQKTWVSSDKERLISINGKFVQSSGLSNNFKIINPPNIINVFDHLRTSPSNSDHIFTSFIQFSNPTTHPMKINYSYSIKRDTNFDTRSLIIESPVYMLEESFTLIDFKWSGKNVYWITSDGFVWRAKQEIVPNIKIRSEILQ